MGRALAGARDRDPGADVDADGPGTDPAGRPTAADRVRAALVDLLVAGIATALSSAFLAAAAEGSGEVAAGIAACLGLVFRRRWPWLSVLAALPAFYLSIAYIPLVIALFDLGLSRAPRWQLAVATVVSVVAYMAPLWPPEDVAFLVEPLVDATIYTVGPALLGAFLRERQTARAQLGDLRAAQDLGERQAAEVALARERAVLAREMHDVVSHQVSLIAVQAGAMQVGAADERSREAARTIRGLSTVTLEELRGMVEVLRAAGGERRELAPQPTLADVPALVAASGIRVETAIDLPDDLPASAQRAVYRTVQEGLTNARKHATGAAVRITGRLDAGHVVLEVDAGAATLPLLVLPSGRHGLTGLRERAQLLGGTLTAETRADGSHLLRLRFPL
ncbi:sensor histidine kinase [Clavibacter michiganensis]|nr:histidine kinase [Clavibacter michiganensis]